MLPKCTAHFQSQLFLQLKKRQHEGGRALAQAVTGNEVLACLMIPRGTI
jgi:hypothetical protein